MLDRKSEEEKYFSRVGECILACVNSPYATAHPKNLYEIRKLVQEPGRHYLTEVLTLPGVRFSQVEFDYLTTEKYTRIKREKEGLYR